MNCLLYFALITKHKYDRVLMNNHHILTHPNTNSPKYYQARYHYLLQILYGEVIAIDYCRTIATFAPSKQAQDFLLKQQVDEEKHLELLTEYVSHNPRPHASISESLKKLDALMSRALEDSDYVACIFIQNFIIEGLNITLLRELEHHADGELSELCTMILKDEIEHMDFGIQEIKQILKSDHSQLLRKKLIRLQRKALFYATGLALTLIRETKSLGIPVHEFVDHAVNEHIDRVKVVNLQLPIFDIFIFKSVRLFLKIYSKITY